MKYITQTIIIPSGSHEEFAVFDAGGSREWPDHSVTLSGISDLAGGYRVNRTSPSFHLLLHLTSGTLQVETPDGGGTADGGTTVFLPAGRPQRYFSDQPFSMVWFHLRPEAAEWRAISCDSPRIFRSRPLEALPALAGTIHREGSPLSGDPVLLKLACQLVQRLLVRELSRDAAGADLRRRLGKSFDLAFRRLSHPWNIAELAAAAGVSGSYFFAAVRKVYGKSPGTILTEARLTAAAGMLRSTGYKLELIAELTGFGSGFALSRAFRRIYGISPGRYRSRLPHGQVKSPESDM